jgi:hypothetical protein
VEAVSPGEIVVSSWSKALLLVVVAVGAGVATGRYLFATRGVDDKNWTTHMNHAAIALLLLATLGHVYAWRIQSIDGQTTPELVNDLLYRGLYFLGSYLLAVAAAWPQPGRWG